MGISVSAKCPRRSSNEPEFNKICFDDSSERETVIYTAKKKEPKTPVPRLHLPSKSASSASSVSGDETSDLPENEDMNVLKKTNIGEVKMDKGSVVAFDNNDKTCTRRIVKPSEEQTSLSWKCDILGGESDPDEVGWASHLSGDTQQRDLPRLGDCDPREKKAVNGLRVCSPSPLTRIRPDNETKKSFFIEVVAPKQKKTSQNRNFILRNKKYVSAKELKNDTSYSQLMTNKLLSAGESSMTGCPSHLESQPSPRTQQDPSPLNELEHLLHEQRMGFINAVSDLVAKHSYGETITCHTNHEKSTQNCASCPTMSKLGPFSRRRPMKLITFANLEKHYQFEAKCQLEDMSKGIPEGNMDKSPILGPQYNQTFHGAVVTPPPDGPPVFPRQAKSLHRRDTYNIKTCNHHENSNQLLQGASSNKTTSIQKVRGVKNSSSSFSKHQESHSTEKNERTKSTGAIPTHRTIQSLDAEFLRILQENYAETQKIASLFLS